MMTTAHTQQHERWLQLNEWLEILSNPPSQSCHIILLKLSNQYRLDMDIIHRFDQILSTEEITKCRALKFETDQLRFIMSRLLLRFVASSATEKSLESIQFIHPPMSGMPPKIDNKTNLSLSRSGAYIACAVNSFGQIGIDIEYQREIDDLNSMAKSMLTDTEYEHFKKDSLHSKRHTFLKYWTAKEAALKAYETGFSISPKHAHVTLNNENNQQSISIMQPNTITTYSAKGFTTFKNYPVIMTAAYTNINVLHLACISGEELIKKLTDST